MSQWGTRPSPFSSAEVIAIRALIGGGVAYTDGQLLIGATSDGLLHAATLTAGSGISITNGSGAITVAATGSTLTVGSSAISGGTSTRILYDNAGTLGEYTISGSGTVVAMATSPSFTTPTLGVATATSINKMAITAPATSSTLAVADGKTFTSSNTITLAAGADGQTFTFPSVSTTVAGLGTTQTFTGINTFTPAARTSGSASYLTINAPADTGITTTAESIGINHVGATRTWVDGTVATQREYLFQAPTYNKTTTSATFTKAATLAVSAAPTAGTGVTITNAYAFWVQAGLAQFDGTLAVVGHVTLEGVTSTGATGTGNIVFSASPTFTGTLTAATSSFSGHMTIEGVTSTGATGTGKFVFDGSPTITTPTFTTSATVPLIIGGSGTTGTQLTLKTTTGSGTTDALAIVGGNNGATTFATFSSGALTISTTGTFTTGTIELGAATDTTIARVSAGKISVEGVNVVTVSSTDTLTNKTLTSPAITAPAITGVGTADILKPNNNAVTVTSNAGTCSSSFELNTFTNSSAATMAITVSTSGAVDGQKMIVRIYDATAAAQTIGWTNTENSTVSVPTTSNGSTTLPLTVGFIYNGSTSKWRCVASA